jgi:hypothetical protein
MTYAIVAATGLLAALLTIAWCREFRLRRALQSLPARIFAFLEKRRWNKSHEPPA